MPSLLNKKELASCTEFEKPGKVVGYSNITLSKILESDNESITLQVFSEEGFYSDVPPIGQIIIKSDFYDNINLLSGLKTMDVN